MRGKDKQETLRTAQKAKEAVGEDSPDEGFQEGFRVRMWSLEPPEALCWRLPEVPPLPWAQQRLQQREVARPGAESLGWQRKKGHLTAETPSASFSDLGANRASAGAEEVWG